MSATKSYYVDINRFSAQDSESDTTNIWDYSLNDTIVAPAGSEVSIHQAFINQKGITGQSIEIEEDINETINYYAYISEQDHSIPILGDTIDKKGGKRYNINGHYDTHIDLLNNVELNNATIPNSGREKLWGWTPPAGTREHLESFNFGGSGAPLILSSKPDWDKTQTFILNVSTVNPDEYVYDAIVGSGTDNPIGTTATASVITFTQLLNGLIRPGAILEGASAGSAAPGFPPNTRIHSIDTQGQFAITTLPALAADAGGGGDKRFRIKNSGNGFDEGKFTLYALNQYPIVSDPKRQVQVGMRCRFTPEKEEGKLNESANPNALATVSRNYDLQVKSVSVDGSSATIGFFTPPPYNTTTQNVIVKCQNNVGVEFSEDPTYYLTPQVLSNNIFIKKGTYGIEQLITIINNQFNGLYKDKTQIPTNPITEALIAQDWNGLLNSTQNGLTKVITPIQYTNPPDNVAKARVNPSVIDTLSDEYPDHTFVSAYDYAELRNSNQLEPNTYNYTTNIVENTGLGYVAYIQNNLLARYQPDNNSIINATDANGDYRFDETGGSYYVGVFGQGSMGKRAADYQIMRGFSVGAPEFNIQYDTDLSAFSLNNLHSSYRIASHDKQGNPNSNSGEVAVGIKSVADIMDCLPWSVNQSVYGSNQNSNPINGNFPNVYAGKTNSGTNTITDVQYFDSSVGMFVNGLYKVSINAQINQISPNHKSDFPAGGCKVMDFLSYKRGTLDPTGKPDELYSFVVDKEFTNDREINFEIVGEECDTTLQKKMRQSYEKPLSRNGGVIVHNFAYESAMKYGDRRSVIDKENYNPHASFSEFFSSEVQARKIWKTKTLWGKLGFTYEQLNDEDYFENIIQYTKPTDKKLRGITTDTQVDLSTIPTISTQNNPTNLSIAEEYGGAQIKNPQNFNNLDTNRPRTAFQRQWDKSSTAGTFAGGATSNNNFQYSGSPYNMATCINVLSKPTPITAQELPTLSRFGYYLITSDLVPTYKDIVAKGDPLGLLGVVPKTSLSSQDFIPLATSDLVQVLNQDTIINNIRVKVLNPDLSNPNLSKNSAIILRIDTPIQQPPQNTEEETKTPKKK